MSRAYRADTADEATQRQYAEWLGTVRDRAPAGGDVLDLGCGNGIPAAKWLSDKGFRVTGVDLSDIMVERARELVPGATFLRGDVTVVDEVDFDGARFDALVSFYALIHMPLTDQPGVIARAARWLRPGGLFVATVGHRAWTGTDGDWLGGGAPMWWSHPEARSYRAWIESAGLAVDDERFVPEGSGGHTLFVATRTEGPNKQWPGKDTEQAVTNKPIEATERRRPGAGDRRFS